MKLNYKRTILTGLAFFLICAFWQVYDSIIPKILTDKFGLNQFWSGIIMALDNLLAVFLLPLFGTLSDRHTGKHGRRTPFILAGTLAAAIAFVGLSFVDNMQLTAIASVEAVTDGSDPAYESAMTALYQSDVTVSGKPLSSLYTLEEFCSITPETEAYQNTVIPARQAYAWLKTAENPVTLAFFMVLLFLVLLFMATFRSPAVALMPDITPKPLRSKGNAIINLMGTVGGILVLALGIVFGTGQAVNALMPYRNLFVVTALLMLTALALFLCTVRETKWAAEADAINTALDAENAPSAENADTASSEKLPPAERRSLLFILASVLLWYMGYNAVTSKYSVYAGQILSMDFNMTLIVAQAAAVISYIPVGMISSRIGRRKTILAGVAMLGIAFFVASFLRAGVSLWLVNLLFVIAGIGWAAINVNSYPMVVELAKSGSVGKYTVYYYTASMFAQIVTPVLSGAFMTAVDMTTLFPYGTVFVALSFVTMLCVRHGDVKPVQSASLLENLDVDT